MSNLKPIIEDSMKQYAGAVLQSRALIDVRDGLKPSARQIFYSMKLHKLTSSNPYKKTANAVGMAMADFYIHGDSSCEGVIMRAGQSFAMRYPLVDVKGNAGTLIESGNWAAMRYTESRLSKISDILFSDIDKDTIDEWRDSYDNTKQFPGVLPSKGFYNIVNGTQGIGIGMASSVPQFNLKELNNALIYLIDNPDCDFKDIYCAPDFATGGILYNEAQVKESMKNGTGFACKLRSVVDFDTKERCFVVTEIPYGVYTNTICGELEEIINGEDNPGVDRFNDLTGKTPLIKIYLSKKANPDKVLRYLYKNTSLQYYYGINFTMLDHGRFPKVFTWKEMLQAHIDHEREVYRRGFEFDLKKIEDRIHIIDGLLICMASIDEVVHTIKSSASAAAASVALQQKFLLDAIQAKAVLDMKLSRLAHLEVKKLEDERETLEKEATRIHSILEDEELFKEQLKNGWREVSRIFGDARRTKVIELAEGNDSEPIERKQLSLSFTNNAAVYVSEVSSLYTQKRNGVGTKFKLEKDEYIVDNIIGENTDTILFFTSHGNFYHVKMSDFIIDEKQYLSNFVTTLPYEHIIAGAIVEKLNVKPYIIFVTKNGIIKKSELSEYNLKRNIGATAIKLDQGDEIVSIVFTNDDKIGMVSEQGNFIMITTSDIRPIGRVSRGVIGMKLNEGDHISNARIIEPDTTELVSISEEGHIKRTSLTEFKITGRATKGVKIQNADKICDFLPINNSNDILVVSSNAQIRIKVSDIPLLTRGAQGVKSIKLAENSKITKLSQL
jgi:DNA gyrase subunit A